MEASDSTTSRSSGSDGSASTEEGRTSNENLRAHSLVVTITMVGNSGVGKTAIMNRYVNNTFTEDFEQRGDGNLRTTPKTVTIGGRTIELLFVDGSGLFERKDQKRMHPDAIVLVYDVSTPRSFRSLDKWLSKIAQKHGKAAIPSDCYLVIGNKSDKARRKVPYEKARKFLDEYNIENYVEMSAKANTDISDHIEKLITRVLQNRGLQINTEDDATPHHTNGVDENIRNGGDNEGNGSGNACNRGLQINTRDDEITPNTNGVDEDVRNDDGNDNNGGNAHSDDDDNDGNANRNRCLIWCW